MDLKTKLLWLAGLMALVAALQIQGAAAAARSGKSKCPSSRELEMDKCAASMGFLGDHSFVVPKNESAMSAFCSKLKDSIGCIQSYSRDCLQGLTKQILTGLLKRGKHQYQSICQTETARNEFRTKLGCMSDDKIGQFHECMDASIARFEFIRDQVRPDHKLPALCCSYQLFFVDTVETLNSICGAANEAIEFVLKLVTGTTGEFLQLVCEGHRSMDDCKRSDKTKEPLRKLDQVTKLAKIGKLEPRAKSLIPPLLEILDASN